MIICLGLLAFTGCGVTNSKPIVSEESMKAAKEYNIDLKKMGVDCDVITAKEDDGLTIVIFIEEMLESEARDADINTLIDYLKSISDEGKFEVMLGGDEEGVLFLGTSRTFRVKIKDTVYRGTISDNLILYEGDTLKYDGVQYKDGFKINLQVDPVQTTATGVGFVINQ